MRIVQELGEEIDASEIEAVVITGDGGGELRRLRIIAERFGSDEVLWFPQRSERYLGKDVGIDVPGFEALRALELYKSVYQQHDFLFITDSEHVSDDAEKDLRVKLQEETSDYEIELIQLNGAAFYCECLIGSQDISIHTAVVGNRFGFIEDCISDLAYEVWGNEFSTSDKQEFKTSVNMAVSGNGFQSLVDTANDEQLKRAFPSITAALEDLAD